jgi:hypothetical protein
MSFPWGTNVLYQCRMLKSHMSTLTHILTIFQDAIFAGSDIKEVNQFPDIR